MGRNDGQHDLFWQVFAETTGSSRWSLVTPVGVADNGGLVLAAHGAGANVLVGFDASQSLTYSPLAATTDRGATWLPGGLDEALATTPDAVAIGSGSTSYAVAGNALRESSGNLTAWTTLVTASMLGRQADLAACHVGSLADVAVASGGAVALGVDCSRGGIVGLLTGAGRTYRLATVHLVGLSPDSSVRILRLVATDGGLVALLATATGSTTRIYAAWSAGTADSWRVSPPLDLGGAALTATGTGGGGRSFVTLDDAGRLSVAVIPPSGRWTSTSPLPARTATVAFTPTGALVALAVNAARLTVFRHDATGGWSRQETMTVPLAYGSSS